MDFKTVKRFVIVDDEKSKSSKYSSDWFEISLEQENDNIKTANFFERFITHGNPDFQFYYHSKYNKIDNIYKGKIEGVGENFILDTVELKDELEEIKSVGWGNYFEFLKEFYYKIVCYTLIGKKDFKKYTSGSDDIDVIEILLEENGYDFNFNKALILQDLFLNTQVIHGERIDNKYLLDIFSNTKSVL